MTTKKVASKTKQPVKASGRSMLKAGKDPKGGLTAEGRKFFNERDGSHLRPGVQGPADTPEKKVRKGSFLRRHFAHPRGPMERDGEPTRLALSAQAWGEPLPKTASDAKELADKGHKLLEQYHAETDAAAGSGRQRPGGAKKAVAAKKRVEKPRAKSAATSAAKKVTTKNAAAKKVVAKKSSAKKG